MTSIDLRPVIGELSNIDKDTLKNELRNLNLNITDQKYHNAFSAYGLSKLISGVSLDVLKSNRVNIPDNYMEGIRWSGVVLLRGYITMVYMRSGYLESGLDNLTENSPIFPFKRYFGRGRASENTDTISQHIRNSFSHGTFELSDGCESITFNDRGWVGRVQTSEFIDGFCEQAFRLYEAAFSIENNKVDSGFQTVV